MSRRDGHILLAVYSKTDRVRNNRPACLIIPERLTGEGVERIEIAFVRAAEYEAARSGQHARPGR